MLAANVTASVNARTGRLIAISASSGIVSGGTSDRIAGSEAYASAVPTVPAATASEQALGRATGGPVVCGSRRALRARSSRAGARRPSTAAGSTTFAQAISSSNPTAPSRTQTSPAMPLQEGVRERQDCDAELFRELRRFPLLEVRNDRPQIRFRLRVGHAGLQAAEQVHVTDAFEDVSALEWDRQVHVRAAPHEALRHDADHGAHDRRSGGAVRPSTFGSPPNCRCQNR